MLSKLEQSKILFNKSSKLLICPICKTSLQLEGNSLVCENEHNFNISKKGVVVLQTKTNPYTSDVYTKSLFENRRRVIKKGLYAKVYDEIAKQVNKLKRDDVVLLDLGAGEASHLNSICKLLNAKSLGFAVDISKPAVELASDYIGDGIVSIVADTNNLVFADNSIDVAIDFLSPISISETMRALKPGGIIVKVIPNSEYLKEIRSLIGQKDYERNSEVLDNIQSKTQIERIQDVKYSLPLDEETKLALIQMTPLTNHVDIKDLDLNLLKNITIDLKIITIKK